MATTIRVPPPETKNGAFWVHNSSTTEIANVIADGWTPPAGSQIPFNLAPVSSEELIPVLNGADWDYFRKGVGARMAPLVVYDPAVTVAENTLVRDGEWLGMSLEATSTSPAPTPRGDFAYLLPDDPTGRPDYIVGLQPFDRVVTGTVAVIDELVEASSYRAWFPEVNLQTTYRLLIYDYAPATPTLEAETVIAAGSGQVGWNDVPIRASLWWPGQTFLGALLCTKTTQSSSWTWNWTYAGIGTGDPGVGGFFEDTLRTQLQIHEQDDTLANRDADLSLLKAGDELTIIEEIANRYAVYSVVNSVKVGSRYTVDVNLLESGQAFRTGRTCSIAATINAGFLDTQYMQLANYWPGIIEPGEVINGFRTNNPADITNKTLVLDDNAYGVDALSRFSDPNPAFLIACRSAV